MPVLTLKFHFIRLQDFYLPEDVGIPIGGPEEPNVYVLATHYENEDFLASKKHLLQVFNHI